MLRVSTAAAVSYLGGYLRDSGYDVTHLSNDLELSDGLFANHENLEALLAKTGGDSRLRVLARLFFVCWPVEESVCRKALADEFLEAALGCGLLTKSEEGIVTSACLLPFRDHILACDSVRTRTTMPDMVTGPSASTYFPARLAVGGAEESTLDLGTGTGALALEAAGYSRRVTATDINPRALQFAAFNAALNNVTNVEWRLGNAFEPVAGERFTRIVANPPFFLSPTSAYTYCDSPMDLDGFTAQLASEASGYLEEGGYFQMICEWVELEGEPWQERLRRWTADSKCDVLVLVAPKLTPLAYAEKRTKESRLMQSDAHKHSFDERFRYLTDRRVRQIIGGVISMRKRSGAANWFTVTGTEPVGNQIGADVRARFENLTFVATAKQEEYVTARLQMADDVVVERREATRGGTWETRSVELVKLTGLVDRLRLDETVSSFLPLFNGTNTLGEMSALVSKELGVSPEEAWQRCQQLARRLLQSNFVKFANGIQ